MINFNIPFDIHMGIILILLLIIFYLLTRNKKFVHKEYSVAYLALTDDCSEIEVFDKAWKSFYGRSASENTISTDYKTYLISKSIPQYVNYYLRKRKKQADGSI